MFRWLRWQLAKERLADPWGKVQPRRVQVSYEGHPNRIQDLPAPNTRSYEKLASLWDDYASWFVPDYAHFLPTAGDYYGRPPRTVLDLACGTGLLSRRLAVRVESVVGLDLSAAMLQEAGSRTENNNVRYVQQDFRNFSLGLKFDAAVCASDSYVETPGETARVFRCVHRHLQPGGLFVFDVLDDRAFRALAGIKVVASVGGECFEIYHYYDPFSRFADCRVAFQGASEGQTGGTAQHRVVERHRRLPIEEDDVRRAADEARMELIECFSSDRPRFSWKQPLYARRFYVLRRPPDQRDGSQG